MVQKKVAFKYIDLKPFKNDVSRILDYIEGLMHIPNSRSLFLFDAVQNLQSRWTE